jgi:outer membrane receptor protein involved in Fe transport
VPADSLIQQDDSWNALLPSLAVTRHLTSATDLVVTLSRGFKPGGYSAYTGVPSLTQYDPQTTWGLEAALSTSNKDSQWSFTSRAYAYRVSGYQIERSFAVPNTGTDEYLVVNAKRARVLGLEVESTWRPVTNVAVTLAAGLTDVTLQDFTDPYTGMSYSGDRAPYAPTGNGALRIDYRPARGFFASADMTWTGKTFYDEKETAYLSQDAYTLFNASAGYSFARADIRIFGRNLGDKAYYSAITPGVGHATPGAPGTWGGEINYRW